MSGERNATNSNKYCESHKHGLSDLIARDAMQCRQNMAQEAVASLHNREFYVNPSKRVIYLGAARERGGGAIAFFQAPSTQNGQHLPDKLRKSGA